MTLRKLTAYLVVVLLTAGATPAWAAGTDTPSGSDSSSLARARALIDAKSYQAAIPILTMITAEEPQNADAFNWLGFSLRKSGDTKAAEIAYRKALAVDPDHKGALEYLGELYVETKRLDQARQMLAKLRTLCPGGCEELEDLGKMIGAGN